MLFAFLKLQSLMTLTAIRSFASEGLKICCGKISEQTSPCQKPLVFEHHQNSFFGILRFMAESEILQIFMICSQK